MPGPSSTVACRTKLRRRYQQPDESVGAFMDDLRLLAGDCEDSEQLVRDQLIHGLRDSALRKRVAELPGIPTLSDILQLVQDTGCKSVQDILPWVRGRTKNGKNGRVLITKKRRLNVRVAAGLPLKPPAPVHSLPPEVLVSIFKLLDVDNKGRVAQVCRSWRDAAMLKEVWRDTSVKVTLPDYPGYHQLAVRGVRQITLQKLEHFIRSPGMPSDMLSTLPHLTHLNIRMKIGDYDVRQLSTTFKMLVSLKLGGFDAGRMTDASITSICAGLKRLEHLTLNECIGITDAGMQELAHSDLPLQSLYLEHCNSLTDASLQHLSAGKPALKGLELSHCPEVVSDAGIKSVATMKELLYLKINIREAVIHNRLSMIAHMKSLRTLDLSFSGVDDSCIVIVSKGSAPIDKLVLGGCTNLTDASLKVMATMPRLRQLDVNICITFTQKGLECLMRGNHNLTSLDIMDCYGIKSEALECIVASQPNLQRLNLNSYHVGQVQLGVAARKLRHLTVLNVDGQNRINGCDGPVLSKRNVFFISFPTSASE